MPRFKFEKLAKYPHMKPKDVRVWEKFIEQMPGFFEHVDYDFHVGRGLEHLDETDPENRLYQKKIDVVGYNGDNVTLVEVKPIADMRGLGQILVYANLYAKQTPAGAAAQKMVIARTIERETEEAYEEAGIVVMTTE